MGINIPAVDAGLNRWTGTLQHPGLVLRRLHACDQVIMTVMIG